MANSTAQTIEAVLAGFPHQQIAPIIGKPTYATLAAPLKLLGFNAQSLVRPDGADDFGNLNLIRADASYMSLLDATLLPILTMPPNPVFGGTQAEISERQYYHAIDLADYLNQKAYNGALKQQVLGFVELQYLEELNDHTTGFNAVSPKQLIAHLKTKYAKITSAMMEKNIDKFREPLDLSLTIETWLKTVAECKEYALEGGDPISDVGMVNNGYNRFNDTHAFVDDCKRWKDRTANTKTWAEFIIFFTKAYNEYADSPESMRAAGIANQQCWTTSQQPRRAQTRCNCLAGP